MISYGLPVVFALFLWWFSTGVILYLDGLPRATHRWTMMAATLIMAVSLAGIAALRDDTSVSAVYFGFLAALGVWAWNETAFLTGFVTGSRRTACPDHLTGWRRFVFAVEMIAYHELAILLGGLLIWSLSIGADNQVAMATYFILWIMRLSTKVNLFLGVPNAPTSFLPEHLSYLASAFRKRSMNLLFPVSVTAGTLLTGWLVLSAVADDASAFDAAHYTILATLTALAVLEHWFFVLPLPSEALWTWGRGSHDAARDILPTPLPRKYRLDGDGPLVRAVARPFANMKK